MMVLVTVFSSCSSSKRGGSGNEKKEALPTLSYLTFGAKATVSMDGFSVGATLRMKKDSCVSLSVQPFAGVEVARLFATDKEVYMVDRINKRYAVLDMQSESVQKSGYGKLLSVKKLQSLLTNQLFLLDEKNSDVTMADFSASQIADAWLLQYADPKSRFSQEFTMSSEHRVKNGSITSMDGAVRWVYDQFEPLETGYYFPMAVDVTVRQSAKEGGYRSPRSSTKELSILYKKIELNKDYGFSNPIPKGYEKVTFQEMLSLLKLK